MRRALPAGQRTEAALAAEGMSVSEPRAARPRREAAGKRPTNPKKNEGGGNANRGVAKNGKNSAAP